MSFEDLNNFKDQRLIERGFAQNSSDTAKSFVGQIFDQNPWFLGKVNSVLHEPSFAKVLEAANIGANELNSKISDIIAQEQDWKILIYFLGDKKLEDESYSLFLRLVQALGLKDEQWCLHHLEEEKKLEASIIEELPLVVISLGARPLAALLESKERLTKAHGKFHDSSFSDEATTHHFRVFPIFHPDFLLINPSMKRTTWNDLKKLMDYLREIPS